MTWFDRICLIVAALGAIASFVLFVREHIEYWENRRIRKAKVKQLRPIMEKRLQAVVAAERVRYHLEQPASPGEGDAPNALSNPFGSLEGELPGQGPIIYKLEPLRVEEKRHLQDGAVCIGQLGIEALGDRHELKGALSVPVGSREPCYRTAGLYDCDIGSDYRPFAVVGVWFPFTFLFDDIDAGSVLEYCVNQGTKSRNSSASSQDDKDSIELSVPDSGEYNCGEEFHVIDSPFLLRSVNPVTTSLLLRLYSRVGGGSTISGYPPILGVLGELAGLQHFPRAWVAAFDNGVGYTREYRWVPSVSESLGMSNPGECALERFSRPWPTPSTDNEAPHPSPITQARKGSPREVDDRRRISASVEGEGSRFIHKGALCLVR